MNNTSKKMDKILKNTAAAAGQKRAKDAKKTTARVAAAKRNSDSSTANTIAQVHSYLHYLKRDSTIRGRGSAMNVFHHFMDDTNTDILGDLQSCDDVQAKGEIVVSCILDFATWLKRNPVQAQGKDKALLKSCVGQYFGSVKAVLQEATHSLDIWEDHEKLWYSALLLQVKDAYTSNILEGDMPNRDPTSRAIHLKCSDSTFMEAEREWKDSQGADLDSMIKSLLRTEYNNASCHEERLKILLVYFIVGRAGMLKFIRHDFNIWDHYARSLQGVVTRLKTRTQHPFWIQCVPFCDKSSSYRVDFLHAFGSWAAVEDGLFRMDPAATGSKFWFPHMRMFSNEKVAKDVTKVIKKVTAPCMQPSSNSRGLRVGSSTKMAMHKDISSEEQRQAMGHSGGTSTEIYVRMNPNLGIPASLCLAEWDDVRRIPSPPTLDTLGLSQNEIDMLIDKLYIISLDEYKTGKKGNCRILLRHCTASLIMYYPMYVNDYDIRMKLPMKLIRVMKQCNFAADDISADHKLKNWSETIRKRFVTVNNLMKTCDEEATQATMMQIMNNQSVLMNKLILADQETTARRVFEKQQADEQAKQRDRIAEARYNHLLLCHNTLLAMINKVGTVQGDFVTESEARRMQYRVLEMENNYEGASPLKANGDIFNNKKRRSTLVGTETVAGPKAPPISQSIIGPKAPPISQSNNEEAPIATSATGDVDYASILKSSVIVATSASYTNVPILKSSGSGIEGTTATTGMTARTSDIVSYDFFGKRQTANVVETGTVSSSWSTFMENIQSYIPKGSPLVDLSWKIVADVSSNAQYTVCAIIERLMEDGALLERKKLLSLSRPTWVDSRNSGDYFGTLKLCDSVMTKNEMNMIAMKEVDRNKIDDSTRILKYMLNSIQQRAFDKMSKLDGQTGGRTRPTIAMGKRWKTYYSTKKKKQKK